MKGWFQIESNYYATFINDFFHLILLKTTKLIRAPSKTCRHFLHRFYNHHNLTLCNQLFNKTLTNMMIVDWKASGHITAYNWINYRIYIHISYKKWSIIFIREYFFITIWLTPTYGTKTYILVVNGEKALSSHRFAQKKLKFLCLCMNLWQMTLLNSITAWYPFVDAYDDDELPTYPQWYP